MVPPVETLAEFRHRYHYGQIRSPEFFYLKASVYTQKKMAPVKVWFPMRKASKSDRLYIRSPEDPTGSQHHHQDICGWVLKDKAVQQTINKRTLTYAATQKITITIAHCDNEVDNCDEEPRFSPEVTGHLEPRNGTKML